MSAICNSGERDFFSRESLRSGYISKLRQQLQASERQLTYAELKIQVLEEQLRAERISKYGPKSDSIPSAQLDLLEAEPGVSSEEIRAEAKREPVAAIRKQPHPGQQHLPAELPRVERVIVCSEEQSICAACG